MCVRARACVLYLVVGSSSYLASGFAQTNPAKSQRTGRSSNTCTYFRVKKFPDIFPFFLARSMYVLLC